MVVEEGNDSFQKNISVQCTQEHKIKPDKTNVTDYFLVSSFMYSLQHKIIRYIVRAEESHSVLSKMA